MIYADGRQMYDVELTVTVRLRKSVLARRETDAAEQAEWAVGPEEVAELVRTGDFETAVTRIRGDGE